MTHRPEIAAAMHDLNNAHHTLVMMLANDSLMGMDAVLRSMDAARTRLIVLMGGE